MTVGPTDGGPEAARPAFRPSRRLVDELGLATCSMGMTDDLEVAVEEGDRALGTALFGTRRVFGRAERRRRCPRTRSVPDLMR